MCFTLSLSARKTDKETVTYKYLRKPLEKLDASIKNYSVEVEVTWKDREQQKQKDYETELAKAEEEYKQALKEYNNKSTGSKLAEKALLGEEKPTKRHVDMPTLIPQPEIDILGSRML